MPAVIETRKTFPKYFASGTLRARLAVTADSQSKRQLTDGLLLLRFVLFFFYFSRIGARTYSREKTSPL